MQDAGWEVVSQSRVMRFAALTTSYFLLRMFGGRALCARNADQPGFVLDISAPTVDQIVADALGQVLCRLGYLGAEVCAEGEAPAFDGVQADLPG